MPKSNFKILPDLANRITSRTNFIEQSLSSHGQQADIRYYKFLIRQRDKSPPTQSRLARAIEDATNHEQSHQHAAEQTDTFGGVQTLK